MLDFLNLTDLWSVEISNYFSESPEIQNFRHEVLCILSRLTDSLISREKWL